MPQSYLIVLIIMHMIEGEKGRYLEGEGVHVYPPPTNHLGG